MTELFHPDRGKHKREITTYECRVGARGYNTGLQYGIVNGSRKESVGTEQQQVTANRMHSAFVLFVLLSIMMRKSRTGMGAMFPPGSMRNMSKTSNERKGNTVPDINLCVTQAFSNIGKGYSAIENFCMAVNVSPFSSRTYSKYTKLLHKAYGTAAETLLREVHSEVRKAYEAPTDVPVVDISVSYDGSC
ncbi:uncharacterized protein TNCV_3595581 [Trichonephila clavipes]|nr:uncharacterized protein TNCV_3595581 [Trichonephila clavipes]